MHVRVRVRVRVRVCVWGSFSFFLSHRPSRLFALLTSLSHLGPTPGTALTVATANKKISKMNQLCYISVALDTCLVVARYRIHENEVITGKTGDRFSVH